ncbi:hypothetical protein [Paenibacillus sp. 481]|uniref:hypothetical protein n=1 Tax=Paenibacillus sp. 481 TaxID=2835869 RepID=UPI001E5731C9|nr:hypothetical protein [Paenibacillus sp. 481]UHA74208.1 hypothetical protein KIK04_03450 [Paenibacillus sp. 481]
MKKKWMILCLSLGIVAFGAVTIHSSATSGTSVSPVTASDSVVKASLQANATEATPEAVLAAAARVAWVYGTNAAKAAANALDDVMRNASMYAGTTAFTSQDPATEQIFDK